MNAIVTPSAQTPQASMADALRLEAAIEPDAPSTEPAKKETQVIAIYGKGGIGKSFTLANLSYMMAQQGKRVLLIGCDPKSDTTSLLFGGRACPTIIETSSRKKAAGEKVAIGDVCFIRDGVFAMELGGPEVGRGCGGRGIIHGFELLEKLGFHDWGFDYVLLDFLGDVVCGGFGLPIARDMCQKVIVVGSNDLQSLYVANNVCSAVDYFRKMGGNVGVAGMVINKDDGTGEAQAFAAAAGIPVLSAIPANEDIRRKSANYEIVGVPGGTWAPVFEQLAQEVADAPPVRPTPLSQDALLGLFKGEAVGRNVVLQPATMADMCASAGLGGAPVARSRLRGRVSLDGAIVPAGVGLPRRPADAGGGGACRRQVRRDGPAGRRLPARPARPAAIHVPGLRRASGRPTHAPHRDHPVRLRLLRIRADLHLAFLRRAPHRRLRAVQLRDAGARPTVRGHPRRGVRGRQARGLRRRRGDQPLRADRVRRAAGPAAQADRRRARDRHRRAGLRRADPCRGQGRAGRCHAALCPHRGRGRAGRASGARCTPCRRWR